MAVPVIRGQVKVRPPREVYSWLVRRSLREGRPLSAVTTEVLTSAVRRMMEKEARRDSAQQDKGGIT